MYHADKVNPDKGLKNRRLNNNAELEDDISAVGGSDNEDDTQLTNKAEENKT